MLQAEGEAGSSWEELRVDCCNTAVLSIPDLVL